MRDWISELLWVLLYSKKTQYAILIGIFGFLTINLVGDYMLRDFHLTGILAPLSDLVKDKLMGKYDKVALCCLFSFLMLAIKLYRKDKRRLFRF